MTALAGFQGLLGRLAGADDLVVGTPIANRNRRETEGLIGLFVNALALRGELAGDPDFATLLGRSRETTLGAYAHQDLPFGLLVESLLPERSLERSPLFQAMLGQQNLPEGRLTLPDLVLEPVAAADHGTAKYELTFFLLENPGHGLHGMIQYR